MWSTVVALVAIVATHGNFASSSAYSSVGVSTDDSLVWDSATQRHFAEWAEGLLPDAADKFGAVDVVGAVVREKWDYSDPDFAKKLIGRQTPVILENSPVTKWKALSTWSPDHIVEKLGPDVKMYAAHSRDGNFLFHSESKAKTADPSYKIPNQ